MNFDLKAPTTHTPFLRWQHYLLGLLLPVIALIVSKAFGTWIEETPFALFYGAVALVAYMGGLGPGLVATVVSIIIGELLILRSIGISDASSQDVSHLLVFAAVCILICWLSQSRLKSLRESAASRDQFEALLETLEDAVTAQDATGKVVFANKAAAHLLGYPSVEAMIGLDSTTARRRFELFDAQNIPIPFDKLPRNRVFAEGAASSIHFKLRYLDDSSEKWIHLSSAPLLDANDRPVLAVNIFRDVTELVEAEQKLRQILDNLPALVGLLALDGTVIEANQLALTMANLNREDVIGKHFADTYPWSYDPNVQQGLREHIAQALKGETVRYEAVIRLAEEKLATIDFQISPIKDRAGNTIALLPSALDITERIQMQHDRDSLTIQLTRQQERLETIVAHVPGIVWEGIGKPDGDQKILYVNPYAETLLGYPLNRWYEEPPIWREMILEEDMPRAIEQAMNIFDGGNPGVIEFRVKTSDGRTIPIESYASIIQRGENEETTRMCGVMMDVSQRKRSDSLVRRYMGRLKTSNDELKQFAYIASHDLQEPLRMVSSYLQLIEGRYHDKLDADGKEFIRYAVDGANRMKRLIQDLLLYSRVESHKRQYVQVNMNEVLLEVRQNLEISILQSGATIRAEALPEITADHSQMTQLIQNLVANAIKFRGENPPEITITAKKVADTWQFAVCDNGLGIDPKYQEKMFVIFQRLHGQGQYPGTGIGLAICKRIVERHGGRIWVDSMPGQGSTFFFTIADHLQNESEEDNAPIP
jgi:PAS domain S-box-containing protein